MDTSEEGKTGATGTNENGAKNGTGNDNATPGSQPSNSVQNTKPKTEELNITGLTDENPNTIHVDWSGGAPGKENDFFSGPTKPIADNPQPSNPAPSSAPQPQIDSKSFSVGIKVLIAVIDFIMSNILAKIAGDKYASTYTADKESKENLHTALSLILEENKVKLPTWVVVLFAFLGAYGFQIMAAIDSRKEKSQVSKDPSKLKDKETLKPGVFERDGKLFRRYDNGAVHERKFNPVTGTEILIGKPSRRRLNEAA